MRVAEPDKKWVPPSDHREKHGGRRGKKAAESIATPWLPGFPHQASFGSPLCSAQCRRTEQQHPIRSPFQDRSPGQESRTEGRSDQATYPARRTRRACRRAGPWSPAGSASPRTPPTAPTRPPATHETVSQHREFRTSEFART
jgi:hypothetical protein